MSRCGHRRHRHGSPGRALGALPSFPICEAIRQRLRKPRRLQPEAIYIGNFLGSSLSRQTNLGALLTDNVGLGGIKGITVEAAEASAAAALRMAYLAIRSGFVNIALVVGVEKFTDGVGNRVESAVAEALRITTTRI